MPEPPSSLTLRRFSNFAIAWGAQEEHERRAEREQDQLEKEHKRRAAEEIRLESTMVFRTLIFPLSQYADCLFLGWNAWCNALRVRTVRV